MNKINRPDQSFDGIAAKFDNNIYGSTKGQLRHELLLHYLNQHLDLKSSMMNILDAGGGTGVMAEEMLALGHHVVLNDISADTLERAQKRLNEDPLLSLEQGPIQSLASDRQFDLVLCHAVLEWLEQPLAAVRHLLTLVKPGGTLSLSFFNRDAHVFGNLLYGNFDFVRNGLSQKNTVRLNPHNTVSPQQVLAFLAEQPVAVTHRAGIRCIHDYMRDKDMQKADYDEIKQMELVYGSQPPYMWIGKYFHILVKKL